MPTTLKTAKQDLRILLCAFLCNVKSLVAVAILGYSPLIFAIPPNHPVTNTGVVEYRVGTTDYTVSGQVTVLSDANAGNSPPYGISNGTLSVDENAVAGVVGGLTVLDLDPADSHSFSVSDARFDVVAGVLQLAPGVALNFEVEQSVPLAITATDPSGASVSVNVVVAVNDLNEAPTSITVDGDSVVAQTPGAIVGAVIVEDPDNGDSHTFAVDDTRFEVVNGELKLVDGIELPLGESVTLVVTATDSGGLSIATSVTINSQPPGGGAGTNVDLTLSRGVGPGLGSPVQVYPSQCDAGSGFLNLPDPTTILGQVLAMPGQHELANTDFLKSGDALFVQVTDVQANLDDTQIDSMEVQFQTSIGDQLTLRIFETALSSGNFSGYVVTTLGAVGVSDCVLQVGLDDLLTATYVDPSDANRMGLDQVRIDPLSIVFDAASGQRINDARITLVNSDGSAAQVFADDGATNISNMVSSGMETAVDGTYRFPFVAAGNYLLNVQPPNRFRHPSARTDTQIQSLATGPYALSDGSRGQLFAVPVGPAFRIDIPLDIVPIVPTPSEVVVLSANTGNPTETTQVLPTACYDGSAFVGSSLLTSTAIGQVALPSGIDSSRANRFRRGDAVLIRVVDLDQDLDPFAPDTIEVQLSVNGGNDRERLRLTETGDSTGEFTGFIQISTGSTSAQNNCELEGGVHSEFQVTYTDSDDASDLSSASAIFDPVYRVFSSDTGTLLNGAEVTLIDVSTGLQAVDAVFGPDGVTPYPAAVVSGAAVSDGVGGLMQMTVGGFAFPVIAPGTYRLEVVPPESYTFPSAASDAQITELGSTFSILPGSRGGDFDVGGGLNTFDVPLDPVSVGVFLSKEASKETVSVGDFLQYQVTVISDSSIDVISQAQLLDRLPKGFRYVQGSARFNGAIPGALQEVVALGEGLTINLDRLQPREEMVVSYVVEVTPGAENGIARNQVEMIGVGVGQSSTAFADVLVKNDLFVDSTFIVGRVVQSACGSSSPDDETGVSGVRIVLEDGSFVVTDADGKYHFQGVEPGTHVLQLDTATLPIGLVPLVCDQTTVHAGSQISQFVDLQAGALWRTDFAVGPDQAARSEARIAVAVLAGNPAQYRVTVDTPDASLEKLRAMVQLPTDATYVPGSTVLNGRSVKDPRGVEMGALNFNLPNLASAAEYQLTFSVHLPAANPEQPNLESKAVLMFEHLDSDQNRQRHRSDVVVFQHDKRSTSELKPVVQSVPLDLKVQSRSSEPYQLPEQNRGEAPKFDAQYLIAHQQHVGIVFPRSDYNPVMPAIPVAVVHPSDQRPYLLVDGELVSPLTLAGTTTHKKLGLSLTTWDGVPISETDSRVELQLAADNGDIVATDSVAVHFSGAAVRAEFIAEKSYLVADGLHPPMLAVRLFDRAGYPLRAGTTGEFSVPAPYQSLNQTKHLESMSNEFTNHTYRVLRDGIAYIQLEPTVQTGEVVLKFRFDAVRQETIRARLLPGQRDWIMVGLLEGSFSERDLEGHMESIQETRLDEERDGRFAFYAKGTVKGDWLLTVAYDTDKKYESELYAQIDPNQYYTLYGDGTEQLHDAESQQKLYLKVERGQFEGLFGDFDTEFQKSMLARYERRLNGLKGGYHGRKWEVKGWLSDTRQGFVRDEIQGDGTSGVYRLSQQRLVRSSELVKVVTRDRFSLSQVLSENTLTRYQDYTVDYDRGTLIFREPIAGQDENFNPIFIDIEYEVEANSEQELTAGVRAAYKLDDQDGEMALTYLNDEGLLTGGELLAADLTWQLDVKNKLTVEYAQSDQHLVGEGSAYLAELEHNAERLAGRIYIREQEAEFGLGHQSAFEKGVRQYGVEGEYRASDAITIRSQAFEQTMLEQAAERQIVEAQVDARRGALQVRGGVRAVSEDTQTGSSDATQLTVGASRELLQKRLTLRVDGEVDLSSSSTVADYADRAIFGAEYKLLQDLTIIGEHELTFGDLRDTQDTRIGLRAKPWRGADVHSMLHRRGGEQGERLFATTGVMQQWRVSEAWLVDLGFDQVNTFAQSARPGVSEQSRSPFGPATGGSIEDDFQAFFVGAGYQQAAWSVSSRLEHHRGDEADKWNLLAGANRQLAEGRVVSGSIAIRNEQTDLGGVNDLGDLRFGMAWRPAASAFTILSRTDLVYEKRRNGVFNSTTQKLINNSALNYKPNAQHQLSINLGIKYTEDQIDDASYRGTTALLGGEYRYFFAPRWDLGVHASSLASLRSNVRRYAYGASVGMRAFKNSWISVGYNVTGFEDDDFVGADYSAEGFFLKFRLKFDQLSASQFLEYANIKSRPRVEYANGR